jgi:hypothetical protein
VILRQQQAGCVRRELPERDLADVAALLQLDDVFGDGIVEPEITIADRPRQQRRLERFPQRSEIEQRVGGDRPVASAVGPAVIEEQAPPFDAQSHGDATGTVGRYDRRDVSRDDPLRVTVGGNRRAGDQCRQRYRD